MTQLPLPNPPAARPFRPLTHKPTPGYTLLRIAAAKVANMTGVSTEYARHLIISKWRLDYERVPVVPGGPCRIYINPDTVLEHARNYLRGPRPSAGLARPRQP